MSFLHGSRMFTLKDGPIAYLETSVKITTTHCNSPEECSALFTVKPVLNGTWNKGNLS